MKAISRAVLLHRLKTASYAIAAAALLLPSRGRKLFAPVHRPPQPDYLADARAVGAGADVRLFDEDGS
ncbi:hypothetical protein G6F65_023338 [Rhizopus arrhizus]|nr:hypothetical protein G6F65_023338 [Rhizopus arrhizus]